MKHLITVLLLFFSFVLFGQEPTKANPSTTLQTQGAGDVLLSETVNGKTRYNPHDLDSLLNVLTSDTSAVILLSVDTISSPMRYVFQRPEGTTFTMSVPKITDTDTDTDTRNQYSGIVGDNYVFDVINVITNSTLSSFTVPQSVGPAGPAGADGQDGVGIPQVISKNGNTVTLSDGGGNFDLSEYESFLSTSGANTFLKNSGDDFGVGRNQTNTWSKLHVQGKITAGISSTGGDDIISGAYTSTDDVVSFCSRRSTAEPMIGYATGGLGMTGASDFRSTASNAPWERSIFVSGRDLRWFHGNAQSVEVGVPVTMTEYLTVLGGSGNVGIEVPDPTAKLDVNGDVRIRDLDEGVVLSDANGNVSSGQISTSDISDYVAPPIYTTSGGITTSGNDYRLGTGTLTTGVDLTLAPQGIRFLSPSSALDQVAFTPGLSRISHFNPSSSSEFMLFQSSYDFFGVIFNGGNSAKIYQDRYEIDIPTIHEKNVSEGLMANLGTAVNEVNKILTESIANDYNTFKYNPFGPVTWEAFLIGNSGEGNVEGKTIAIYNVDNTDSITLTGQSTDPNATAIGKFAKKYIIPPREIWTFVHDDTYWVHKK